MNTGEWRAVLPELLKTLDAVRSADISGTTGHGLWDADGRGAFDSWQDFLLSAADDPQERRTHGWRSRLHESPDEESAFFEAFRLLESSVFLDHRREARHLVHSDLHLNLLASGRRVTGLLDWGCSLYGDFLYDHACLAYWAPGTRPPRGSTSPTRVSATCAQ
jgi:hygromycin-B 4-O-kinase